MAIAFDAKYNSVTPGTATSLTYSHTCTGSDLILVVGVLNVPPSGSASAPTGVTYNGDAMTKITDKSSGSGRQKNSLWYLINPDTGTHDVVVTLGGNNYIGAISCSYTGVAQSGALDVYEAAADSDNERSTPSSPHQITVTTTEDNELLVSFMGMRDTEASTKLAASSPLTAREYQDLSDGEVNAFADQAVSSAGNVTATWTSVYDQWTMTVATFKEVVVTNIKINIGDVFKDAAEVKINIGDTWKAVESVKINIGDDWKTVF